jgi:predicted nucleic acid-binding protein
MSQAVGTPGPAFASLQETFLIDTDLLSLLERKRVPPKLTAWVQQNDGKIFLSVVSFAEL